VERGKVLLGSWHHYGGDGWLLPCLALLALGLGALAQRRYAFLHSFLLLEALGLLLNLLFVLLGSAADDLGGSVLVLFSVAVAAAETAVGLALFLALSQGSGLPQRRPQPLQRRRVPLTPPVAMPRPSQTTPNPTIPTPTHQITSLP
jgi:NADH-quinone oxidoreductase subunit K